MSIRDLIDHGYLCPLISKATDLTLDVGGVGSRGGEFIPGQLQAAVDRESITTAAIDEILAYGEGRRSWLAFCSGVEHATHVAEALRERGVSCGARREHSWTKPSPCCRRRCVRQSSRRGRQRPHGAGSRMDAALPWLLWLAPLDAEIVWRRASGERWKSICWSVGLARAAAHKHWLYALCVIAWRLNGRAAPKGVGRRELIGRLRAAKERQA